MSIYDLPNDYTPAIVSGGSDLTSTFANKQDVIDDTTSLHIKSLTIGEPKPNFVLGEANL